MSSPDFGTSPCTRQELAFFFERNELLGEENLFLFFFYGLLNFLSSARPKSQKVKRSTSQPLIRRHNKKEAKQRDEKVLRGRLKRSGHLAPALEEAPNELTPWAVVRDSVAAAKDDSSKDEVFVIPNLVDDDDDDDDENTSNHEKLHDSTETRNKDLYTSRDLQQVREEEASFREAAQQLAELCKSAANPQAALQAVLQVLSPPPPVTQSCGMQRDWTGEYHRVRSDGVELQRLLEDFHHTAVMYGTIIASERRLPNESRTIREVQLGGLLGGRKYLHHGLMFKFADGDNGKAPSHELKSLSWLSKWGPAEGLFTPLFMVLRYAGQTVSCQTVVPIGRKQTLVYGSADVGKSVSKDAKVHDVLFRVLHQRLGLASHEAGADGSDRQELYTPCDGEIHEGTDKRMYCIDMHRLSPSTTQGKMYWEQLFRFEFLEAHGHTFSMSSDVWSSFCGKDSFRHEQTTLAALEFLKSHCIKSMAKDWKDSKLDFKQGSELIHAMHKRGINVRFLPLLYREMKGHGQHKDFILVELVARGIKRALLRQYKRMDVPLTSLIHHCEVCADTLTQTAQAREDVLKVALKRLQSYVGVNEWIDVKAMKRVVNKKAREVITRVCELVGATVKATSLERLLNNKEQLQAQDVHLFPRVKRGVFH